jgi:hypothetical protein
MNYRCLGHLGHYPSDYFYLLFPWKSSFRDRYCGRKFHEYLLDFRAYADGLGQGWRFRLYGLSYQIMDTLGIQLVCHGQVYWRILSP